MSNGVSAHIKWCEMTWMPCTRDKSREMCWLVVCKGLRTKVVFERALHAGLSTLISVNETLMPFNAACLKHARGNDRPYCVLKHARNASIPLRDNLVTHIPMKRTLRDMTHSVRSTPLTTISTAALWKNHRRTWCTIAHKENIDAH